MVIKFYGLVYFQYSIENNSAGDLPNPDIKPRSPALQVDSLPAELQGKPKKYPYLMKGRYVVFPIRGERHSIW